MKNLLAKFYKSLACRVALAVFATTAVAKAHDLPQHFPLAPTDWGMIQQDCMGYQSSCKSVMDLAVSSIKSLPEITITQPDNGNPPEPFISRSQLASNELIAPALYDGVDCAKLESHYRNLQSDQQANELVEYKRALPSEMAESRLPTVVTKFEFHKSFFAACSCDFEWQQANQSITPPKFTLKRTYVEDHFASEFNHLKPLVLRDFSRSPVTVDQNESLAIAIPTSTGKPKRILAQVFSQLTSYDCIIRSELYSGQCAFQLGEIAGSYTKSWFADALPAASHFVAAYAQNLKPVRQQPTPMFVIYQTAGGNEVAIPIAQAKEWDQSAPASRLTHKVEVSQELKELVASANARLQWAGGRLSAAASYMNDWFSDRIAREKSDELR